MDFWREYFVDSKILTHARDRVLMYFNLPYDDIISKNKEPKLTFYKYDFSDQKKMEQDPINTMLNKFETEDGKKEKRLANLILMQFPASQYEAGQGQMRNRNNADNEQIHIIGAYASHGWAVNKGMMDGGNKTCFLFNFHKNLRFNAVPGKDDYMSVETATLEDREQRTIIFGEELQISSEFKKVESKILRASDPNAKFIFGDKHM